MALTGDPTAMRLRRDRLLPPCRERAVAFRLPPLETARTRRPSPHRVSLVMNAVILALARGEITPGEAERAAGGGRHLRRGDRDNQKGRFSSEYAADFDGGRWWPR
jgi:hypothetical protein